MANARNSNTYFIDTASVSLDERAIKVLGIIITGNGGAAELKLADNDSGASYPVKFDIRAPSNQSIYLDFVNCPVFFPTGIRVVTANNVLATLIIKAPGA